MVRIHSLSRAINLYQLFKKNTRLYHIIQIQNSSHPLTLCPWKVRTGLSDPSLHTCISLSAEHDAKQELFCQSTSKVGSLWKLNCCFISPVLTSHTTAVLSTPPVTIKLLLLFHLRANMGPEWWTRADFKLPSVVHSLATPSYDPVASRVPSDYR